MLANFALHPSQLFPGATSLLKFMMASLRAEDVSSMTVVQLLTQLASRGLETSGRKALLVQRLSEGVDTPVDTAVDTSVDRDREEREPA